MLRATTIVRRPAVKAERVADTLSLDHEARKSRHLHVTGKGGLAFHLDLEKATVIDDGDAAKLEDGRLVVIRAAPQHLLEIRTENPLRLARLAWRIGSRHIAAEIAEEAIYVAHDLALIEMARGLGATTRDVQRPFRPERDTSAHDHGHGHAHDHHQGHDHHGHAHHGHAHHHHDEDHGGTGGHHGHGDH